MKVKIKKLYPDVKLPSYAHLGDAGLDLYSREEVEIKPGQRRDFALGFKTEMPQGYAALIWDKSSLPFRSGIHNLGGVIDATYRGEWHVVLQNLSGQSYKIKKGDKIAQALIQPVENVELEEVEELNGSTRGEGGFGSTGRL